jgi:lipopolysaccharide transport system ATP-binding protein
MSMSIHLRAHDIKLSVPHFVQTPSRHTSWLGTIFGAGTARPERVFRTILHGVTFNAEDGDRVALIGRNGAGKSSLLRVLTGAYPPTSGWLDVQGSRQALLNVSLGFNAEATVAENILLRGTAMGMSAGQRMRLGFAISTSIQRDIMLLDEWLGAGDMQFIRKARSRMNDSVNGSRIVVLATHNLEIARRVCNKGLVLEQGQVVFWGGVIEAIMEYRRLCR